MGKSYKAEKSYSHLEDGNKRSASRKSSSRLGKESRRNGYPEDDSLSSLDAIVPARFLSKISSN